METSVYLPARTPSIFDFRLCLNDGICYAGLPDYGMSGLLKFQENCSDDEKNSQKIALLPIAFKFGPQEVNRFSQLCA